MLQARIAELEGAVAAEKAATALAEQGRAAADEELVRLRAEVIASFPPTFLSCHVLLIC